MKLNRFVALALVALLAIGAMGLISTRSSAKATGTQTQATQVAPVDPAAGAQGQEEAANSPDTDDIQEEVGEQVEDGFPDAAEASGAEDAGPDDQTPVYAGSIAVDQAATNGLSEAEETAALSGQATITSDEAQAAALAANPGATVVEVELDNENGALVYSVELSTGVDVKVDAGNGAILHTETGEDYEG